MTIATAQTSKHKYTPAFWRMCFCSLLFFGSFNMIIPELPDYLRSIGGAEYVGFIIFLFTVTALLARPYSGKWADAIGRVPVMLIGALLSAVCGFLYLFTTGVFVFLLLRLIHGFSTGFTPTGSTTYVADIVPAHKRGEAMGIVSLAGSLGMAIGPAFGSWIMAAYGYDALFLASSLTGFAAAAWMFGLKETLKEKKPFDRSMWRVRFVEFYEPKVLAPTLVFFLSVFAFGATITLIPDRCAALGLENKGLFFTVFTVASIFVRFSAGKISDRIGREKVLVVSTTLIALAMIRLGTSENISGLLVGSVLFGLGNGINSPTVMAWSIDLSIEKFTGRAMATVYMGMELGVGAGALLGGTLYAMNNAYFMHIFLGCAVLCLIALAFLLLRINKKGAA